MRLTNAALTVFPRIFFKRRPRPHGGRRKRQEAEAGPEAAQPPKAPGAPPAVDNTGGTPSMGAAAAPQESPTPGEPEEASAEAAEASQDTARRCTKCTQDRPRHAFSPLQWAGKKFPKTGNRGRLCMRCAPKTAESGQRYCQQCDRAKPTGDFGPDQGGKIKTVRKVCRSCTTQQSRLSFFVNGTQSE